MRNQIDLLRARGTQLEKNKVLNDAEIERQRTFEYGWERAFKNYENNATNAATEAADVFTTMSKSMEDAIVSFAMTGKINFKSFAASVIKNLVEIQAKKLAAGILGSLFGGASGANAPGGANFGMDLGFEANGGAYNRGIKFFAGGGVVSSRTGFGMASGGIGVMGEAGPEAIMPLKRGANGKLGVAAQGGGGGVTQVNNMSVHIGSVDSDERQQELMKEINNMIIATSKRTMADQMRKGNMLNPVR
jgi:lambda family phage tail tape measure protein